MALLHHGASRKRDIGMASAAPQYHRPSLAKTVRLTNISALRTHKPLRPPQVLKILCACRVIGEYPLKFWERRRETTGIHDRNVASEYLIGNKPDRHGYIKLSGREGFRIRVNNYRVIYEIDGAQHTLKVMHVGHRRDVYC